MEFFLCLKSNAIVQCVEEQSTEIAYTIGLIGTEKQIRVAINAGLVVGVLDAIHTSVNND